MASIDRTPGSRTGHPRRGPPLLAGVLALALAACGRATTPIGPAPPPDAGRFDHVILVVEENHGYTDVIGDSAMPYLNSLADSFGLATRYFADTHPSIGNYFMLATGQVVTNDDGYATVVDVDNVARRLVASGRTWKSYAEDLPSVGYVGGDTGAYARKHNVFALLSDVVNDSVQRANLVPFTRFAQDLAAGSLPDFANIVPNLCHDGHDCSLAVADAWLRDHIRASPGEPDVPGRRAVDHHLRRGARQRCGPRRRTGAVGGGESAGPEGLPLRHLLPAREHAAAGAREPRGEPLARRRGRRAVDGSVLHSLSGTLDSRRSPA